MSLLNAERWVSIHVFYQGDLDLLITEVLDGFQKSVCGVPEYFFLRYWDGGPHVRFRFLAGPSATPATVRSAAERVIRSVFDRHPSAPTMSEATYVEQAVVLGKHEGVVPEERLAQNDSLEVREYRPETERYGVGGSLAAVEKHFVESSALALRLLQRRPTAEARVLLASRAAVISHDALLTKGHPDMSRVQAVKPEFDAETSRLVLRSARLAIARGTSTGAVSPEFIWHRSITALIRKLDAVIRSELPVGQTAPITRIVDLCTHLFCNRIGVDLRAERLARTWLLPEQRLTTDPLLEGSV